MGNTYREKQDMGMMTRMQKAFIKDVEIKTYKHYDCVGVANPPCVTMKQWIKNKGVVQIFYHDYASFEEALEAAEKVAALYPKGKCYKL